jgi:glycosyltransferase involved in cell wall biosynthesis
LLRAAEAVKVLAVVPFFGDRYGGPTAVLRALSAEVGKLGVRLTVAAMSPEEGGSSCADGEMTGSGGPGSLVRIPRMAALKFFLGLVRDYDLIHIHGVFSPFCLMAEWASFKHRVPFAVTSHGMLEPWALSYKSWKKKPYYLVLEKPALSRAAAMHALSDAEAGNIVRLGLKTPVAVIPNGIFPGDYHTMPPPDAFYAKFPQLRNGTVILFLGRIDPKKGLDLLARAFAPIAREFPDARLVVAGPDNIGYLETARAFFREAGCFDRITFAGMLNGPDKIAALAAADVFVAPSYSEGFSVAILEAMAAGLPVVITRQCNFPEVANEDAGFVIEPDAGALRAGMRQLLSAPEEAVKKGARGRALVLSRYTWPVLAARYKEFYSAVCERRVPPYKPMASRTAGREP